LLEKERVMRWEEMICSRRRIGATANGMAFRRRGLTLGCRRRRWGKVESCVKGRGEGVDGED
jgi:hypothetical protein